MDTKERFFREYKKLDEKFNTNVDYSYEYLVNFSQVKNDPIHRWFYYQEGYSPQLVINLFNYLNLNGKGLLVFDPFSGSGTTLLTSKQLGLESIGFEINPFSAFMIKAKTRNYTSKELENFKDFKIPEMSVLDNVYEKYELKIIENLYNKEKLSKIELLKKEIGKYKDKKVKNLLYACLLSILEDVSNYRKGGNGLKRKRVNKDLDPFEEYNIKFNQIYEDLKNQNMGPEPNIINDSCLNIDEYNFIDDIDVSIFSPPYANCFDPFEVYKIELWVGEFVSSYKDLRKNRKCALTSNLSADVKKEIDNAHRTEILNEILEYLSKEKLWDKRIPKMIDTYFFEMFLLLEKIYKKTKKEGYCIIVVGNSAYGNLSIPTDIILAQMGEKAGFSVEEIIVARKNETSSQQHKKLGNLLEYIRESIVVLKK